MKFAGVEITQESIKAAEHWFAEHCQACIDEAKAGTLGLASHVNVDDYVAQKEAQRLDWLSGNLSASFTFWQKAHYIQTGESVAFLPK